MGRRMTEQAQRIAIAKWMGWEHLRIASNKLYGTKPNSDYSKMPEYWYAGCPGDGCHVPNYTRDLNATADACKVLAAQGWRCCANMGTDGTWECYFTKRSEQLGTIPTQGDHYGAGDTLALAICEALLRTLNLWTE